MSLQHPVGSGLVAPMPTTSALNQELNQVTTDMKDWDCGLFFNEASVDEEPRPVDLVPYFAYGCCHDSRVDNKKTYMFPERYSGPAAKETLIPEMKIAAIQSGFPLRVYGSHENPSGTVSQEVVFCCSHGGKGQIYKNKSGTKNDNPRAYKHTSMRAKCNDQLCPFSFTIFCMSEKGKFPGRWCIRASTKAKRLDNFRLHQCHYKIKSDDLHAPLDCLTEEERALVANCAQLKMTPTVVANLITLRNGKKLSYKQQQMRCLMEQKTNEALNALSPNASSAEKMIELMNQRDEVSYLIVTYDPVDGIISRGKTGGRRPTKKFNVDPAVVTSPTPQELCESNLLRQDEGDKLLLVFMFGHDEEMRLATMHPEFMAADTVNKTNKEKKGCATFSFLDGNNKAFQACRAFIPSEKAWVFHMLFVHCLPHCLGEGIMSRIRLTCTDGDPQLYNGVLAAIEAGALPNSVHRLCWYHLFEQSWTDIIRQCYPPEKKGDPPKIKAEAKPVLATARAWIKSWGFDCEHEYEHTASLGRFWNWLEYQRSVLPNAMVENIRDLIRTKMGYQTPRWVDYCFRTVKGLAQRTSSISEAMHSSNKNGIAAVAPTHTIAKSSDCMMEKVEIRKKATATYNAAQLNRKKEWTLFEDSDWYTGHSERRTDREWKKSRKLKGFRMAGTHWATWFPNGDEAEEHIGGTDYPGILRVRIVTLVEGKYLVCSCRRPNQLMYPCCHILYILDGRDSTMYSIRYNATFQCYYDRPGHERLTDIFNKVMKIEANRTPDQAVDVTGFLEKLTETEVCYPCPMKDTTESEMAMAQEVIQRQQNQIITWRDEVHLLRLDTDGQDSPPAFPAPDDYEEIPLPYYNEDTAMESSISATPTHNRLVGYDVCMTQAKQIALSAIPQQDATRDEIMNLAQQAFSVAWGDKEKVNKLRDLLSGYTLEMTRQYAGKETGQLKDDANYQASTNKRGNEEIMQLLDDTDEETEQHCSPCRISFSQTGQTKERSNKRTKRWSERI